MGQRGEKKKPRQPNLTTMYCGEKPSKLIIIIVVIQAGDWIIIGIVMSKHIDDVKAQACSAGRVGEPWNKCWFVFQRPHKKRAGGK